LIEEHEIEKVVIGLPLNMDGSEGFMTDAIRRFSDQLKKIHPIEIIEVDERLTSHQADMSLRSAKIHGKRKKARIDTMSAQIILQTYLDSISF
jgi:putative Holliday junction resolvase